jgi:hypothetical protein
MKMNIRTLKSAWRYRKYLWKYRALIRHRRELAGVVLTAGAIILANCAYRYSAAHRAPRIEA